MILVIIIISLSSSIATKQRRRYLTSFDYHELISNDFEEHSRRLLETNRIGMEEIERHWNQSVAFQWEHVKTVEMNRRLRANTGITNDLYDKFPFVVCNHRAGLDGVERKTEVEKHFGKGSSDIIYNQETKTCFFVNALASVAELSPSSYMVHPISSVMKFRKGLMKTIMEKHVEIDYLNNSTAPPLRYHADLCFGAVQSRQGAEQLAKKLTKIIGLTSSPDHYLASETSFFVDSRFNDNEEQNKTFWKDNGEGGSAKRDCVVLYRNLVFSPNVLGTAVNIFLSKGNSTNEWAIPQLDVKVTSRCLLSVVLGIASQPEVCSVSEIGDGRTSNIEPKWIVQSDIPYRTPFTNNGLDGNGQIVAISDTGLDVDNCYFWDSENQLPKNGAIDRSARKVIQYVPYADSKESVAGHGTHVAATLLGSRAKNGRVEDEGPANGIASGAKLSMFDMNIAENPGLNIPSDTSTILQPGIDAGANIHSASWYANYFGEISNQYEYRDKDFDAYMYTNDSFLIIVSAGNFGRKCSLPQCADHQYEYDVRSSLASPASAKNGLTVGASQSNGLGLDKGMKGKEYLAYFSSRGPAADGRIKPEIVAPGYWILSASAKTDVVGECGGEVWMKGTSMVTVTAGFHTFYGVSDNSQPY